MTTPDQPQPPSGWGDAPEPPRYGQYAPGGVPQPDPSQPGQGQYGQGQYGQGQYGQQGQPGGPGPYGRSPYGPSASKPGIVPLRPLTLGEIYDGAFTAIRHNPKVMLGVATLVLLIATVLGVLVSQLLVPWLASQFSALLDTLPADVLAESGISDLGLDTIYAQLVAVSLGTGVTFMVAQPVVDGILTVSVSQSVIGRKLTLGEVWARLRPRVWALIGWSLLRSLAVAVYAVLAVLVVALLGEVSAGGASAVGVVLFFAFPVLLVWLGVRTGLVAPALALEGLGLRRTLPRAWRLTRGSFWRLFGIYLLALVIVTVAANIITYPVTILVTLVGESIGTTVALNVSLVVGAVLSIVLTTAITTIFLASVVALLYVDVRMRREGLDVQLAAAAQAPQGRPDSGPGTQPGMLA